jgi:hypothetical protein
MIISKMTKGLLVLILGVSLCLAVNFIAFAASGSAAGGIGLGTEIDLLPYASGGYYLSSVFGFDHYNLRLITTQTTIPGFVTPKGFDDWDLKVTALIVDYFPGENREGFWFGGGLELWDSEIKNKDTGETGTFSQHILTVGCGYIYNFSEHWYINPWAALHYNLSDQNVAVGSSNLKLPDLMYEASIKLGYKF